jgi:hypothetical protein
MSMIAIAPACDTERAATVTRRRLGLALVVLISASWGLTQAVSDFGSTHETHDLELVHLLQFMAVVKLGVAVLVATLVGWQMSAPLSGWMAAGGTLASGLMIGAPGLIWSGSHVAAGAAMFHAGLVLFVILAWAQPPTTANLTSVLKSGPKVRPIP